MVLGSDSEMVLGWEMAQGSEMVPEPELMLVRLVFLLPCIQATSFFTSLPMVTELNIAQKIAEPSQPRDCKDAVLSVSPMWC